jgi:hypothetical protein
MTDAAMIKDVVKYGALRGNGYDLVAIMGRVN